MQAFKREETKRKRRRGMVRRLRWEASNFQATTGTYSPPAGATALLATHVLRPKKVDAVESAIKMPLSGSHTSSAGRRPPAGAQSSSARAPTPAANMLTVAAAVVYVFSITATRVRTTTAEKYRPLHWKVLTRR